MNSSVRRTDSSSTEKEEELIEKEKLKSCINANYMLEKRKPTKQKSCRFKLELCMKSKDVASSAMPPTNSKCRRAEPPTPCGIWSNNFDNNVWSHQVVTMTAKLHAVVSSMSLQNSEMVNRLIKKPSLVCPKKWKNCGKLTGLRQDCAKRLLCTRTRRTICGDKLYVNLRESQCKVKKLTHEIKELQVVVVSSLKGSSRFQRP